MATRPVSRISSRRTQAALTMPGAAPFSEHGVVGTVVYSGYIQNREKSAKWTGQQRYITIADMAVNTSIIAAGVRYTSGLIAHPKWTVKPAIEGDAEAEAAAELVESIIHDLTTPWSHVVRRAYMYKFYGFGVQEWVAKRRTDGKIGLAAIAPRPQFTIDRWEVDDGGLVTGVWQTSPKSGQQIGIPRSKILYLVDDALSDSPEGIGIFRHLGEPWERLKTYYDLEARAFERDLRGIPIGRIPYTLINQAVKDGILTDAKAKEMVKSMEDFVQIAVKQSDTGLTIDSAPYISQAADGDKVTSAMQWGLELLQGSGGGMAELSSAIKRTVFEMATIMCTQQLLYGMEGSSGNRALSKDMSQNLYLMANASLTDISSGVNKDILGPICLLNNIPDDKRPKCEVEDVAFKDAESVAGVLSKMAQAGAVLQPDDPVIADVRELMGVSAPAPTSPELLGLVDPIDDESESEVDDVADEIDAEADEEDVVKARGKKKPNDNDESGGGRSKRPGGGGGKFEEAKHPRDAGGRFDDKPDVVGGGGSVESAAGEIGDLAQQEPIWSKIKDAKMRASAQYATLSYTGGQYTDINAALRTGDHMAWATGSQQRVIRGMDRAFEATSGLSKTTTLWRGLSEDHQGLTVGGVFEDRGFVSTAPSRKTAEHFVGDKGVLIRITAPKGTRALAPMLTGKPSPELSGMIRRDGAEVSAVVGGAEPELVLPRGTKFKVTGRTGNRVDVEVIS